MPVPTPILNPQSPVSSPETVVMASDMEAVDRIIREKLYSDVELIRQVTAYIIQAGGKRVRPLLVLLMARVFGYAGHHHHTLAAVMEVIHTATLLHDDVVDESELRRGMPAAHMHFGNASAILIGDYLYTRAFQMIVSVGDMRILDALSGTTNTIAEGEIIQLGYMRNPEISETAYLEIIKAKTAKLFEASALMGALVAEVPDTWKQAASDFGFHLGMAFQLVDDVLDYTGHADTLGKTPGDDLREGKMTLPLIYLRQHADHGLREMIDRCVQAQETEKISAIVQAVLAGDAIAHARQMAEQQVSLALQALQVFPENAYREALHTLAVQTIDRKF